MASGYCIKSLTKSDEAVVRAFLEEHYFEDDPVLIAMNVSKPDEDQIRHILNFLDEGYSVCATSDDGKILAVLLSGEIDNTINGIKHLKDEKESCTSEYFRKLIDWYMETANGCRLLEITGSEKALETHIASVPRSSRRSGIMRRLFTHVMEAHRDKLLVCTCASKYTANLCRSLNWACVYCLPYSYFKDGEGNPLFPTPKKPHLHLSIYIYKTGE